MTIYFFSQTERNSCGSALKNNNNKMLLQVFIKKRNNKTNKTKKIYIIKN